MDYKFKKIILSESEKLWLNEVMKYNFSTYDVKSLKVKLWKKLPKDFNPESIDNRLMRENQLTLIGLWHVNPEHHIFNDVNKAIEVIRGLILRNQEISTIKAYELAPLCNITVRDAEIALKLIHDLGGFFGFASGATDAFGFKEVDFLKNNSAFDQFLRFENLEEEMERHFVSQSHLLDTRKKKQNRPPLHNILKITDDQQADINIWEYIKNDFDISKRMFGKKINFVTDKYKRKVIFRDIEHAYSLSKKGYNKPAVILAGSVIEELLRLYLAEKNIKVNMNTFDAYIKACEQNRLLKSGISRLSDSVRHFRNLVHLGKEESKRFAISKATANSAVSSIFTIANDFE